MAIRVEPSPAEALASSEALGELYGRYGPALFRLAYRLTSSKEDAEDVVHDAVVGGGANQAPRAEGIALQAAVDALPAPLRSVLVGVDPVVSRDEGWLIKAQFRGSDYVVNEVLEVSQPEAAAPSPARP